jgi:predicted metal-dependent phosphoesterase TrpH
MSFKIDFHIHTYHSYDSLNKPAAIIKRAIKRGLDAIVVLDHESIKGGLETACLDTEELLVIPAVEINTDIGDIVGLWVREEITVREYHQVIVAIKAQGGLAMLPHPYHKHNLPDDICEHVDLVEINNARAMPERNRMASEFAAKHNKPAVSGSDAHFLWEIGNSYTIFEDTPSTREELIETILKGQRMQHIKYSNPIGIIFGQLLKYWRHPEKLVQRIQKLFGMKSTRKRQAT